MFDVFAVQNISMCVPEAGIPYQLCSGVLGYQDCAQTTSVKDDAKMGFY